MIYTVPASRKTNQHQVLSYCSGGGKKDNPQGSEIDHEGPETAQMKNTKPFEGLGESQDAKDDQEEFHRHRIQATLRRDNTKITGSERLRKSC